MKGLKHTGRGGGTLSLISANVAKKKKKKKVKKRIDRHNWAPWEVGLQGQAAVTDRTLEDRLPNIGLVGEGAPGGRTSSPCLQESAGARSTSFSPRFAQGLGVGSQ